MVLPSSEQERWNQQGILERPGAIRDIVWTWVAENLSLAIESLLPDPAFRPIFRGLQGSPVSTVALLPAISTTTP